MSPSPYTILGEDEVQNSEFHEMGLNGKNETPTNNHAKIILSGFSFIAKFGANLGEFYKLK